MGLNYLSDNELQKFQEIGFLGPFRLNEPHDADLINRKLEKAKFNFFFWNRILSRIPGCQDLLREKRWGRGKWKKGMHLVDSETCKLATNLIFLDKIESILGSDIMLWGSLLINAEPGDINPWHADNEHLEWQGISIWLCLETVDAKQTPMRVITRSHHLPTHPAKLRLNTSDDHAVLKAAQQLDERCECISVDAKPGEFIIFSGKLWHGVKNQSSKTRSAIIFQYSPPSSKVKLPVSISRSAVSWSSRPAPCYLVKGKDKYGYNLILDPPS